jgi:hypothetical protein
MIVVSDTSPMTNLAAIDQLDILRRLFGSLLIPEAVWSELGRGGVAWPGRDEVETASWVKKAVVSDRTLVAALDRDLDRGEAEAIALACEAEASLVLLDEREGRRAALRLGLRCVAVVGVLLEAKERGMVESVQPHLDALRDRAGFYLADDVYRHALVLAGEATATA